MLESTFYATHSSFSAMVGVAEQFGHLQTYLGSVFRGIAIFEWVHRFISRIRGQDSQRSIDASAFESFGVSPSGSTIPQQTSKRPAIIFLLLAFGVPYLMTILVNRAKANVPASKQIKDFEFAKAVHEFQAAQPGDLGFVAGEIIAVLSRVDDQGVESEWWRGRKQDGNVGVFPGNFVEVLPKRK